MSAPPEQPTGRMYGHVFRRRYGKRLPSGYVFMKKHSRAHAELLRRAAKLRRKEAEAK